ncbi:hypothetical protein [Rhodococcus globerulus]|uniref:Uncharacterized protein n=1 Tax=Rhodococcus globerulus TaxID=33008 RepID=A0ABU4C4U1_RHOGO|nr:hypothetical protein [Rhodococcus globerulus]MDV6271520.1 hypothetical protein [Rhodococcus globerulus]
MTNELSTTLEALAHLLDVHYIGSVVARSRRTEPRGVTEFGFTTSTIHRTWSIANLDTGTAETNQNGLYTHFNRAGETVHEAKSPTVGLVPPAIRLCYPLDLPIWGRQRDNFKITHAESTPTGHLIHLAHTQDSTQHGTLTMNSETGLLTRWITYRHNNSIADYELTSIVRPHPRPTSNDDDGTITSISFDDRTNDNKAAPP